MGFLYSKQKVILIINKENHKVIIAGDING